MKLTRWMLSAATLGLEPSEFMVALVDRLRAEDFPVERLVFTLRTMHPAVWLESVRWDERKGAHTLRRPHTFNDDPLFRESPVGRMYAGEAGFRRRLGADLDAEDYPILTELRDAGFTDYLIAPLELAPGQFSYVSCSTRRLGGYSDSDLALWEELCPALAVAVAAHSARMAMASLLDAYLGRHASRAVRSGKFKLGDGEAIDAVIWFSDLRGFTSFTDTHSPDEVLVRLGRYFDVVGSAIERNGGEILKFIGDGVLAVFLVNGDGQRAGVAALTAAREAMDAVAADPVEPADESAPSPSEVTASKSRPTPRETKPIEVGIGLHAGRVTFGNVGTAQRLDFTVIGGAVNEAARVEGLCKELGAPVLVTGTVAELVGHEGLVSAGRHGLRGTRTIQELFTFAPPRRG